MQKFILKKCKSFILALLIVPMLMLSFNSQRANAVVPVVAVVGGIEITADVAAAVATVALVAGHAIINSNQQGTYNKIGEDLIKTGKSAEFLSIKIADGGQKILTWTKAGVDWLTQEISTLNSTTGEGIGTGQFNISIPYGTSIQSKMYSYNLGTIIFTRYYPSIYTNIGYMGNGGNITKINVPYSVTANVYFNPYNTSSIYILANGYQIGCITVPKNTSNVNIIFKDGSLCADLPNFNAQEMENRFDSAPKGVIYGIPVTDSDGNILSTPSIPYGKTWSDISGNFTFSISDSSDEDTTDEKSNKTDEINNVEIIDKNGVPLGELDGIDLEKGIIYEDKAVKGLDIINPKTGKPQQTAEEWAEKQIYNKTKTRIINLDDAVDTKMPGDISLKQGEKIPTIDQIKKLKKFIFRLEGDSPELREAMKKAIDKLSQEFPDYSFDVNYM